MDINECMYYIFCILSSVCNILWTKCMNNFNIFKCETYRFGVKKIATKKKRIVSSVHIGENGIFCLRKYGHTLWSIYQLAKLFELCVRGLNRPNGSSNCLWQLNFRKILKRFGCWMKRNAQHFVHIGEWR